jgi:uncharacterized protein YoxC
MSNTKTDTKNPYGYDKLTATELRKVIADLMKSVLELKQDKKDYVSAANEAIKETDARIKSAVEALRMVEQAGTDVAHKEQVVGFLRTVPNSTN